jgi:hypothetical protein
MLFFCFLLNLLRASSVVRVWLPPSATSRRKACGAGQRPPYVSRHCAGLAKRPPALYKFSSFAVSKSPPARSPDPASSEVSEPTANHVDPFPGAHWVHNPVCPPGTQARACQAPLQGADGGTGLRMPLVASSSSLHCNL